jgi:hypothetical protein
MKALLFVITGLFVMSLFRLGYSFSREVVRVREIHNGVGLTLFVASAWLLIAVTMVLIELQ